MSALKDLIGNVYGQLTVIARAEGVKPTAWVCRCSCGAETTVASSNLIQGRTRRCKACRVVAIAETRKANPVPQKTHINIAGQVFGSLTAVKYLRNRRRWLCTCALCGGKTYLNVTELTSGSRTDCGCIAARAAGQRVKDGLTGMRQGTSIPMIRNTMAGKLRITNTTGHTGVTIRRYKARIAYCAQIMVHGKNIHLGEYATLESACQARKYAENKYFLPLIIKDEQEQISKGDKKS